MSIARLALRHGVNRTSIGNHIKAGGWVRLVATRKLRPGRKPRPPGEPPLTLAERRRSAMVRRLLKVLDKKLTLLERRMTQDGESGEAMQSAADAERDMRALSGIARLYAKLIELDEAARAQAKGRTDKSRAMPEATEDADRLRRDLALRLQRLNQARHA